MDLKNLFSKNKAAASGEAKTIKDYLGLIIIVAVVCIFILSYFFLIKPFFTKQENMILDKYDKLSETDKMNSQINALTKKVEELEGRYEAYQYYLDAVKRDGIPYELITKALPAIEGEVNNILAQLVDFQMIFDYVLFFF